MLRLAFFALLLSSCAAPKPPAAPPPTVPHDTCTAGAPMRVHFYDSGQALAALVELPDGRRVLVDAGEDPARPACGQPCKDWHKRVLDGLRADLGNQRLDLIWITHQHSDHVGGAVDLIKELQPRVYADNGRDGEKKAVIRAREAAQQTGSTLLTIDPEHHEAPLPPGPNVTVTAVVPSAWPQKCLTASQSNANECSIGLRIDYCRSSVLFVGDAEDEENELDTRGEVTLLQVGHHGSETSTGQRFVDKVRPKYAVVSCAKKGEGTNNTYCHPRAEVVERLTAATGGAGARTISAFDGEASCKGAGASHWKEVATSDRLWITARDGTVVLTTRGDGTFVRE